MSFKPTPTITLRLLALTISLMAGPLAAGANEEPQPPTNEEVAVEATEPLPEDIDWNALTAPIDRPYAAPAKLRTVPLPGNDSAPAAWSRNDRPNGTAAISVGQPVNSFWDMKAGVDLDVAIEHSPLRTPQTVPEKLASDTRVETSQAAAWMVAKAPGVPYLADHVALEARVNPAHDARLGTAFSKSLPLHGQHVALTLRHGYYVTQHDAIPGLPAVASQGSSFDMERSAQLSLTDTGTSFVAGQSLSPASDRWLSTVGAQQQLFDGLSITGSVSETRDGFNNTSLKAAFKASW